MTWFRNLKISNKLFLAFGITILVVIIANTIVITKMRLIGKRSEEITKVWLPSVFHITNMNKLQSDLRLKEYKLVIAQSPSDINEIVEEINLINNLFRQNDRMYVSLINTSDEKRLYIQFKYLYNKYTLFHNEIVDFAKNNEDDVAKELLFVKSKKLHEDMSTKLNELEEINVQQSNTAAQEARNFYAKSISLLILFLIVCFILVVVFSWWIARQISKPIKRLNIATSAVANGDLQQSIEIDSTDEIGNLSSSFNVMAKNIENTMSELQNLNLTLEERIVDRTTELEKANSNLLLSNATKDRFFSIIAHDLRNPMGSLLGISNLLKENFNTYSPEEILDLITLMNQGAENSFKLLENLLEWGTTTMRKIKFSPENIDISAIIKDNMDLLHLSALHKKINFHYNSNGSTMVFADKNMLNTIVRNLTANAVKFTNIAGSIIISSTENNDNIEVCFSDSGIGISEENIAKLFRLDIRHSTKGTANETGTGLGLLLCKEFAEKNGGKIWVESELGKGSQFKFTLQKALIRDNKKE